MNSNNKKRIQALIIILIAVITLGIGYASISAINLFINGNATANVNQNNFDVHFVSTADTPSLSGNVTLTGSASISQQDSKVALFDVGGMTKVGDYAIATYTIINNSNGIGAELSLDLTNSNPEYFKVTETILDNKLQAGEETTAKVRVEMIKTPITDAVSTSITATLTASPLEDAEASGGETKEEVRPVPDPYTYLIRYDANNMYTNISGGLDSSVRTYSNFAAAKADFGHPFAIALDMDGGTINASYIAFEKNGKVYYLQRPTVEEGPLSERPVWSANVDVLKEAFGPDWESVCNDYGGDFICDADGWGAFALGGHVYVHDGGGYCDAFADGSVGCRSWA